MNLENNQGAQSLKTNGSETEFAILGTCILNPKIIEEVIDEGVSVEDFTRSDNQFLFKTLSKMSLNGSSIHPATISDECSLNGYNAFTVEKLENYTSKAIVSGSIKDVCTQLKEFTVRRKTQNILNETVKSNKSNLTPEEMFNNIETCLDTISRLHDQYEDKTGKSSCVYDYLNDGTFENDLVNYRDSVVKTGFNNLDNALGGGLFPGLTTLGAMSSIGKTTLITQIADNIAKDTIDNNGEIQKGRPVIYYSYETSKLDLIIKSITRYVGAKILTGKVSDKQITIGEIKIEKEHKSLFNSNNIKRFWKPHMEYAPYDGLFTKSELELIDEAYDWYLKYVSPNILISGTDFDGSLENITSTVRRFIHKNDVKPVVMIDYLQILELPDNFKGTTKDWMDKCVSTLQRFAEEECISIVVISALNRSNYNGAVNMSAFKETGLIEYSSKVLIGMDIVEVLEATDPKGIEKIINLVKKETKRHVSLSVLKNKASGLGNAYFKYYPGYELFIPTDKDKMHLYNYNEGEAKWFLASYIYHKEVSIWDTLEIDQLK